MSCSLSLRTTAFTGSSGSAVITWRSDLAASTSLAVAPAQALSRKPFSRIQSSSKTLLR
jgi:hypothetical protein